MDEIEVRQMHLTPEQRIDLRIDVNLMGVPIEQAAERYGVSIERVRELCNILDGETTVRKNSETEYRPNHSLKREWPEMDAWLYEHDTNLSVICRACGLRPARITNAVCLGRIHKKSYFQEVLTLAAYTGLAFPKRGDGNV